jgi:hypothetical protein
MGKNGLGPRDWKRRYLTAGKGLGEFFSKIASGRFYFSSPPVSTAHPHFRF